MSQFFPQEANVSFKVWQKDRWAFSAKLPLAYRLVTYYWFLDDMRRVRQDFHVHRQAPRLLGSRYGFRVGYNTWIHRPRQLEASILWAYFSRKLSAFVSPCQCGLNSLLTLLTLSAGSLMLQSWRLLFMLCPIREWSRCRSQLGVISLSSRKACFT